MRSPATERQHGALGRLVGKWWFWAVLSSALFGLPLGRSLMRKLPPAPPLLGQVPAATTRVAAGENTGKPFALSELDGKVWVATFLEPGDPACERLADVLTTVQRRARNLGDDYRIVSFVPPGAAPAEVAAFAARHKPNPFRWMFLSVEPSVETAFSQAMHKAGLIAPIGTSGGGQVHPKHLAVLVDRRGRMRGFYDVLTREGLDALLSDTGLTANLDR